MSEKNLLETRLRSWPSRRPSAKLEQRLFGSRLQTGTERNHLARSGGGRRFGWLAPLTTGPAALALLIDQQENPASNGFAAMISSNSNAEAIRAGGFSSRSDGSPAETFEWTNGASLTSSISSLSPLRGSN